MKKLLIVAGGLILILIIVITVALSNLGPIIKKAVNTYGPDITQTDVRLETVDVSLFKGEATLVDFLLGNPKGFDTPNAMTVQSVHVNIDEKSITKDPVVIETIEVISPQITYELKGKTDNFRALLNNIKERTGAKEAPEPAEPTPDQEEKPAKKILIREFILTDGTVNLAASVFKEKSITVNLPDMYLTDIGGKDEGASPAEVFRQIAEQLYQHIQSRQVRQALDSQLKELGKSLDQLKLDAGEGIDRLGEKSKEELESVKDSVKGWLDK